MLGVAALAMKATNKITEPAMATGRKPHAFTMAHVSGPA